MCWFRRSVGKICEWSTGLTASVPGVAPRLCTLSSTTVSFPAGIGPATAQRHQGHPGRSAAGNAGYAQRAGGAAFCRSAPCPHPGPSTMSGQSAGGRGDLPRARSRPDRHPAACLAPAGADRHHSWPGGVVQLPGRATECGPALHHHPVAAADALQQRGHGDQRGQVEQGPARLSVDRVVVEFSRPPFLQPEVVQLVQRADIILFAPGSLYTSIIPILQVPGLAEAIRNNTRALKVLVANIWVQKGETDVCPRCSGPQIFTSPI